MDLQASANALPASVDVAILGCGFAGAATARALAIGGGCSVAVLEQADALGAYASGRSVGMGRQLAEDDDTTALTIAGAQVLRQHGRRHGLWSEAGGLLTFDDAAHRQRYLERAAAFSLPCEPLDGAALRRRGVAAACGLWVPSDGLIEVRAYLGWLVAEALRHGTQLFLGTQARALSGGDGDDDRFALHTSRGQLRARVLVDAAGAWAGTLTGRRFRALRRHVFALRTASSSSAPLPLHAPSLQQPFVWHIGVDEVYARATADHWLTSPCDERPSAPGDLCVDDDAEPELRRRLARFGASWRDAAVTERYSCQRTFADDGRMQVGVDVGRPRLVWAAALGGHGATAAAAVGARASAAVLRALRTR